MLPWLGRVPAVPLPPGRAIEPLLLPGLLGRVADPMLPPLLLPGLLGRVADPLLPLLLLPPLLGRVLLLLFVTEVLRWLDPLELLLLIVP